MRKMLRTQQADTVDGWYDHVEITEDFSDQSIYNWNKILITRFFVEWLNFKNKAYVMQKKWFNLEINWHSRPR